MNKNKVLSRHNLSFRKWLKFIVLSFILVVIAWFVLVPEYGQASAEIGSLKHVPIVLVVIAALLEIGSLVAFSVLTATITGHGHPRFFTILRIDLTDLGANHVFPGGGTTAAAIRFRLLKQAGISSTKALATASIEMIASNLMLGVVFLLGVIMSLTSLAYNKYYVTTAVVVVIIVGIAVLLGWLVAGHTQFVIDWILALAKRFSTSNKIKAKNYITMMADEINRIRSSSKLLAVIVLMGALNWILDAAALWVVLIAIGHPLYIGNVLVMYGVASILSLLPITPGGIGIVEGVLVPSLVGFGIPGTAALIAVVAWRVLEYWLPIPISLIISYLTLRFGPFRKV